MKKNFVLFDQDDDLNKGLWGSPEPDSIPTNFPESDEGLTSTDPPED